MLAQELVEEEEDPDFGAWTPDESRAQREMIRRILRGELSQQRQDIQKMVRAEVRREAFGGVMEAGFILILGYGAWRILPFLMPWGAWFVNKAFSFSAVSFGWGAKAALLIAEMCLYCMVVLYVMKRVVLYTA